MNILCQLKGHLWNECAGQNGHAYCDRCEREFSDPWGGQNAPDAITLHDKIRHWLWIQKHRFRMFRARILYHLSRDKDKDKDVPF